MAIFISQTVSLSGDNEVPVHLARELRRADSFITFGVLAANKILDEEGTTNCSSLQDRGLFIGSSYGPMEATMEVLEQVAKGVQTSPTLFSHSVFNGAAGYLSRIFQLQGCAVTITDFAFPFFQAVQQAICSLESNQTSSCLVLQIETFSQLLLDARNGIYHEKPAQWQPGACGWLLTNEEGNNLPKSIKIDQFSLATTPVQPLDFLRFHGQLSIDGDIIQLSSPLDAAHNISKTLANCSEKAHSFIVSAPYGEILLTTLV